jgi:hypothetical protein
MNDGRRLFLCLWLCDCVGGSTKTLEIPGKAYKSVVRLRSRSTLLLFGGKWEVQVQLVRGRHVATSE